MKILCLNAWGGKLFDKLIPYLQQSNADVICLQEVVHSPATDRDWLTYRDEDHVLEQRANLFDDIAGTLSDYAATFCPASQGVLWQGKTSFPSQWGIATFVKRTIPIMCTKLFLTTAMEGTHALEMPMPSEFLTTAIIKP